MGRGGGGEGREIEGGQGRGGVEGCGEGVVFVRAVGLRIEVGMGGFEDDWMLIVIFCPCYTP